MTSVPKFTFSNDLLHPTPSSIGTGCRRRDYAPNVCELLRKGVAIFVCDCFCWGGEADLFHNVCAVFKLRQNMFHMSFHIAHIFAISKFENYFLSLKVL